MRRRRDLSRRSLIAGATAAALTRPLATSAQESTPVHEDTSPRPAISLNHLGGDAWAWEKTLTGSCPGCPEDGELSLLVNGVAVPAAREGDRFSGLARFAPGENEVVAVATLADGSEERSAPVTYTVRLVPRPTARLAIRIAGDRVICDGTGSTPSEFDGAVIPDWSLQVPEANPAPLALTGEEAGVWSAPAPAVDGEYAVTLVISDELNRSDAATASFVIENGQARVPDTIHENAGWIAAAVVYGVVPRFYQPPGFAGVAARLDDLADLGVTALWFSPITRTLPGHFGYEVTDYFAVSPEYGSEEEFRALVAAAHQRGMRVLLDFVPNHTSVEHPYYLDVIAHGEASPYWDFYDRDAGGNPTHYFNWDHLPNLNYDHPEVRRFMLEAFAFWVREFDVDGFRVDAVWGIKERRPEWLDAFLAEMDRIKPDMLIVAEASARDGFYFEAGFDAAYDWTEELGHWAWGEALGSIAPIQTAMVDVLTDGGAGYHRDALVMRFLNNNDTGARLITTYGVDFSRVALAMLLTLPGLPCLFTGDEAGAEYQPYEQAGPIEWSDRHGLREETRRLIALRRETPALHSRAWEPLPAEPAAPLFAYLRGDGRGGSPVVVVLNFSAEEIAASVALPEAALAALAGGELRDLWSGERIAAAAGGRVTATVPAWGWRMLSHGDR